MFDALDPQELESSLMPVSRRGAEDLLKLVSFGSLQAGPNPSLEAPDAARDACISEILDSVGESALYFTNHGHAEDGDSADFLASSFHFNSLAVTVYNICIIAVTSDRILSAWRFEDV